MQFPVADMDEGGDRAAQVQQRMQFDRRLGPSKSAQRNRFRHRSIVVESKAYTVASKSTAKGSLAYKRRALRINCCASARTYASRVVRWHRPRCCVGWPRETPCDRAVAARAQTIDGIAQTVPKGQLAESHAQELIPAGEPAKMFLTAEAIDASMENLWMNQTHQLGKDRPSGIHPPIVNPAQRGRSSIAPSSNRSHPSGL